jgi:hypothetical protein
MNWVDIDGWWEWYSVVYYLAWIFMVAFLILFLSSLFLVRESLKWWIRLPSLAAVLILYLSVIRVYNEQMNRSTNAYAVIITRGLQQANEDLVSLEERNIADFNSTMCPKSKNYQGETKGFRGTCLVMQSHGIPPLAESSQTSRLGTMVKNRHFKGAIWFSYTEEGGSNQIRNTMIQKSTETVPDVVRQDSEKSPTVEAFAQHVHDLTLVYIAILEQTDYIWDTRPSAPVAKSMEEAKKQAQGTLEIIRRVGTSPKDRVAICSREPLFCFAWLDAAQHAEDRSSLNQVLTQTVESLVSLSNFFENSSGNRPVSGILSQYPEAVQWNTKLVLGKENWSTDDLAQLDKYTGEALANKAELPNYRKGELDCLLAAIMEQDNPNKAEQLRDEGKQLGVQCGVLKTALASSAPIPTRTPVRPPTSLPATQTSVPPTPTLVQPCATVVLPTRTPTLPLLTPTPVSTPTPYGDLPLCESPASVPIRSVLVSVQIPPPTPATVARGEFYSLETRIPYQFTRQEYICLSSTPDGQGKLQVDDLLQIYVQHDDGSTESWVHDFYDPKVGVSGGISPTAPRDASKLFTRGVNTVRIVLRDLFPYVYSAWPIYVVIWAR